MSSKRREARLVSRRILDSTIEVVPTFTAYKKHQSMITLLGFHTLTKEKSLIVIAYTPERVEAAFSISLCATCRNNHYLSFGFIWISWPTNDSLHLKHFIKKGKAPDVCFCPIF